MTSRTSKKSNERDREIRQHIVQAARELFLVQGYKGVAMKDIAEVVYVTAAAGRHNTDAPCFRWNCGLI